MSQFVIKQGDLAPGLEAILKDETGTVVDLTTATAVTVRIEQPSGTKQTGTATVSNPTGGEVQYAWVSGQTDEVGTVKVEFVVTWPPGAPSTYPSNGHIGVIVNASLA